MACTTDFVQYVVDQCSTAGEITVKKMFGDYGIYCNGKIFGLLCDDCLYIKPTEAGKKKLKSIDLRPPYPGAKDYFYIADLEDPQGFSRNCEGNLQRIARTQAPKQKITTDVSGLEHGHKS